MTNLHILYTANLRGNIELLPRMHTFMRQLKSTPLSDENEVMLCMVEPVQTRWLVLDLGNACDPAVWHCTATEGRSILIALDAMGYHAANVDGALTEEARERMSGNLMSMALVDAHNIWPDEDVLVAVGENRGGSDLLPRLMIDVSLSPATRIEGRRLQLAQVQAGQVGQVGLSFIAGSPHLISAVIHDVSPTTPPDPTISGTVDFILSEARFFQGRRSSPT